MYAHVDRVFPKSGGLHYAASFLPSALSVFLMNMIKVINTVYACVKTSAADDDDFQRLSTGRWGGGMRVPKCYSRLSQRRNQIYIVVHSITEHTLWRAGRKLVGL